MEWHYKCPVCKGWAEIAWDKRSEIHKCPKTGEIYRPPSPMEAHDAYVNTHNWPTEMEDTVVSLKGKKCTVPGCTKNYETLDHRVPYIKGGRTSVANLFPICNKHNKSKGDSDYGIWYLTLLS